MARLIQSSFDRASGLADADVPIQSDKREAGAGGVEEATDLLMKLAGVFFRAGSDVTGGTTSAPPTGSQSPNVEARYRTLVEQIPAVVFMAFLDQGIGEAYVSPQIEAVLGFSQQEWLEDPIRWFHRIHPEDKARWSTEAADMLLSAKPLRSVYRVIARDGHVVWFHCEAKMVCSVEGRPWFIHGVAVDVTELKKVENALQNERNVLSAILDTVGALVVVLDPRGKIVRFNRACEQTSGLLFEEMRERNLWDLCPVPEERAEVQAIVAGLGGGRPSTDYEAHWLTRDGERRLIAWSNTVLRGSDGSIAYIISTGIDVTERKRLERTILEVSENERRRIGQDLHDGLGQHLTGVALMSKVLEQRLLARSVSEATDAAKIAEFVNEAISETRKLARGLVPVEVPAHGLMAALQRLASEIEAVSKLACRFECENPVYIHDNTVATHLYRIAQESVNNAVKHGRATRIVISLHATREWVTLSIRDNGAGWPSPGDPPRGMGLHIMHYRARMIGAVIDFSRSEDAETVVTCTLPLKLASGER